MITKTEGQMLIGISNNKKPMAVIINGSRGCASRMTFEDCELEDEGLENISQKEFELVKHQPKKLSEVSSLLHQ